MKSPNDFGPPPPLRDSVGHPGCLAHLGLTVRQWEEVIEALHRKGTKKALLLADKIDAGLRA